MVRGISCWRKPCWFSYIVQYLIWPPSLLWAWHVRRHGLLLPLVMHAARIWWYFPDIRNPTLSFPPWELHPALIKPLIVSFLWFPLAPDLPHTDITVSLSHRMQAVAAFPAKCLPALLWSTLLENLVAFFHVFQASLQFSHFSPPSPHPLLHCSQPFPVVHVQCQIPWCRHGLVLQTHLKAEQSERQSLVKWIPNPLHSFYSKYFMAETIFLFT